MQKALSKMFDWFLNTHLPANIRLDKDIFHLRYQKTVLIKTSFIFVIRRRLKNVFIKTNIFTFVIPLQETSGRRLDQDEYIRFGHTSWRRFQDVFKMSCKRVFKTSSRRLEDVLKTSWKRFEEIFKTSNTSSKHPHNV